MQKGEGKKSKFSGLFGGLDPTLGLGDKVIDHVEEAQEEEKEKLQKNDYYAFCPNCGRKQIKKDLLEKGCFICGWKGTDKDLEVAGAKSLSKVNSSYRSVKESGYKTSCPNCGASVITEEFLENGCWRCGYKE